MNTQTLLIVAASIVLAGTVSSSAPVDAPIRNSPIINEGGEIPSRPDTSDDDFFHIYLPLLSNPHTPPQPPVLAPISNPENGGNYSVNWSTSEDATRYQLEEDDNASFTSPTLRYDGTLTSMNTAEQPNGTYYYHVRAINDYGSGAWSNNQSVVVNRACVPPSQPLVNSGFELGDAGWTFGPSYASSIVSSGNGFTPHTGNKMASITSYGVIGIDPGYIEQSFSIPECSPYLGFWWSSVVGCGGVSGDRCGGDLSISINGTPFSTLHRGGGTSSWQKIVLDTSAFRGSTVTVRFASGSYRDAIYNYVDDIMFEETLPPGNFGKLNPPNGVSNQLSSITLTWGASANLNYYHYEYCIDTTNDNACTTSWISTGPATFVNLSGLTPATYYWEVRAINAVGTTYADGFYSNLYWSFTITPPPGSFSKTSPANGAINQPRIYLTLTWGASSNALSYEFCLDDTNDNACTTSWLPLTSLSYDIGYWLTDITYYWQVRAINVTGTTYADGETGWWSFTIAPLPGAFNKISPPNGATDQPPNLTFTWEESSSAKYYAFCINTNIDNVCSSYYITDTSTSKDFQNLEPGTYYWQVFAGNDAGLTFADADTTGIWSFTINP